MPSEELNVHSYTLCLCECPPRPVLVLDLVELELQVIVSCRMWVLGTELALWRAGSDTNY